MSLEKTLGASMGEIPECLAAGYVDMSTGMLLAVKTVDSHPSEVLDLVAAATADLFQGTNVTAIEKMFKRTRGLPDDGLHYFNEIFVNSENLIHVFMRGKKFADHALIFVTRKSANIGMVMTKARIAQTNVEASV